jgi:putative two-component system response regulator
MMRHNEVSASERTLKLLEWERIKYDFYASYTKDIMFEYSAESDILTIPKWCAEEYGIDEAIVTPDYNLSMDKLMGTNTWERLNKKLRETTPDSPLVEFQYSIVWNGKPRNISVIARSMWSMEEPYKYIGAIGKLVDSEEV